MVTVADELPPALRMTYLNVSVPVKALEGEYVNPPDEERLNDPPFAVCRVVPRVACSAPVNGPKLAIVAPLRVSLASTPGAAIVSVTASVIEKLSGAARGAAAPGPG